MAKRDTNTHEELIMKTVGIIETLPDRIKELEKELSGVMKDFSYHDGEQRQGIKRTDERIIKLDKDLEELKSSINKIKHLENLEECPRTSVKNAIEKVHEFEKKIDDFELDIVELEKVYDAMMTKVETLWAEYEHKEENKKTIKAYISEAFKSFLRYAMLPFCIIILLAIGIDPSYIPWYKETPNGSVQTGQNKALNLKIKSLYEKNDSKYILEGDATTLYYSNPTKIIIVSDGIFNRYDYSKDKIILWLPEHRGDGYLYFGDNKILIKRR